MNDTTRPQHPTSRNVTKVFSVVTTYHECGVVSSVDHDVIELHAADQDFVAAQLNGRPIGYALATLILNHADSTRLVHESRPVAIVEMTASIGKATARSKPVAHQYRKPAGKLNNTAQWVPYTFC